MNHEDIEKARKDDTSIRHERRVGRLICDLAAVTEGCDYTFSEVVCAMDRLRNHYEKQARNLMDGVSIQEIARLGGVSD